MGRILPRERPEAGIKTEITEHCMLSVFIKSRKRELMKCFLVTVYREEKTKYVLLLLILCWRKRRKAKLANCNFFPNARGER
jgi:hypothetical protein